MNNIDEKTLGLLLIFTFQNRDDYLPTLENLTELMDNTDAEAVISLLKSLVSDRLITLENGKPVFYKLTKEGDKFIDEILSKYTVEVVSRGIATIHIL